MFYVIGMNDGRVLCYSRKAKAEQVAGRYGATVTTEPTQEQIEKAECKEWR